MATCLLSLFKLYKLFFLHEAVKKDINMLTIYYVKLLKGSKGFKKRPESGCNMGPLREEQVNG